MLASDSGISAAAVEAGGFNLELELCRSQWGSRMDEARERADKSREGEWRKRGSAIGERRTGDYSDCLSQSERRLQ